MIPPHSYTSLKMLKTCPHQWYRTYIAKDQPFHETVESKWGNRVHDCLSERLRGIAPLPPDVEQYEGFCLALDRFHPRTEMKLACDRDGNRCGSDGGMVAAYVPKPSAQARL